MAGNTGKRKSKAGRPVKTDAARHCVMVRFSDSEYARFMSLYEQSGLSAKATFIKARVFGETFRVIKTDRARLEYAAKLSSFHAQFRAVGVNYNQVVKELHSHFSQRKTLALLYKLEKQTAELAAIGQQVIALSEDFKAQW